MTEALPDIEPLNRGTVRRPNYHARYSYRGTRQSEPTGARTLAEFAVAKQELEKLIRAGRWTPWKDRKQSGGDGFAAFAESVVNKRVAIGVRTAAKDERGIVRNHLNPEFGAERLQDLTFKRIEAGFQRIAEKDIGGATVRNIYIVFRTVLRFAAKDGLIVGMPPELSVRDGELPAPLERRPEGWREDALFELHEITKLLLADAIEPQYRVMYACYFLTGSRFAEVVNLRVRDYNRNRKPLAMLSIKAGKTGRSRGVRYRTPPVHPALAAWLDWWLQEGFAYTHMREPEPGDWMFPTLSARRQARGEQQCSHGEVYKRWQRHHLPGLKLRHRRLHDARRTLLSLVRSAEAAQDIARAITHTVIADKVLDAYTTFQWEAICKAVMSVHWNLPRPPQLKRGASPTVVDISSRRPA